MNQRRPVDLAGIEHAEDVGMLQPRGELDLALEPLGAERGGDLGVQDLERDGAVVAQVVGEEDDGKSRRGPTRVRCDSGQLVRRRACRGRSPRESSRREDSEL